MRQLSQAGLKTIAELSERHGFNTNAVLSMLDSVIAGNGDMAQFSHPEFGGSGQWMRGGMIMTSDMFDNSLKHRIGGLCNDLAALVESQPDLLAGGSFQSQTSSTTSVYGGQSQSQGGGSMGSYQGGQQSSPGGEPVSLFVPMPEGTSDWWGRDFGRPGSTGAQNNVRYAFFPHQHRLAIEANGTVTVYDTLDHQIGGFSQQQSHGASMTFTSQHGTVDVARLPVVKGDALGNEMPPVREVPIGELPIVEVPISEVLIGEMPMREDDVVREMRVDRVETIEITPMPMPETETIDYRIPEHPRSTIVPDDKASVMPHAAAPPSASSEADVFATLEKLAGLHAKGILTDEEFASKKSELLGRL